jgi:hypothetical protein
MHTHKELPILFWSSLAFLFIIILKFYFTYTEKGIESLLNILWFCNITGLVFCVSVLFFKREFVSKISTIVFTLAIPAQGVWILAFVLSFLGWVDIGRLANLNSLLLANSVAGNISYALSVLGHFLLIPISGYAVYKLGFQKNLLKHIWILIFLLLTLSFLVSSDTHNYNCIKRACDTALSGQNTPYDLFYFTRELVSWLLAGFISYSLLSKLISLT